MQKSHKFVSRKDGRVIYLSEEGKRNLERTAKAAEFKHVGMVTAEERAKEVLEAGKPKKSYSEAKSENESLVKKVKAPTKELSQEEIEDVEKRTINVDEEDKLEEDKKALTKKSKKKDEQE